MKQKEAPIDIIYTTKQGETWEEIGKFYHISIEELMEYNQKCKLTPGSEIRIPCYTIFVQDSGKK